MTHGFDLDNLRIVIPSSTGNGEAPQKICPGTHDDDSLCGQPLHAAVRVCPHCGYSFTQESVEALLPTLKKIEFNEPATPSWYPVVRMEPIKHTNTTTGKSLLRIKFECDPPNIFDKPIWVSEWICFPDYYSGFAVQMGEEKWFKFTDQEFPDNVGKGVWFAQQTFVQPKALSLVKDGKWYKLLDYRFEEQVKEPIDLNALKEQIKEPEVFDNPSVNFTLYDDSEELPF